MSRKNLLLCLILSTSALYAKEVGINEELDSKVAIVMRSIMDESEIDMPLTEQIGLIKMYLNMYEDKRARVIDAIGSEMVRNWWGRLFDSYSPEERALREVYKKRNVEVEMFRRLLAYLYAKKYEREQFIHTT